MLERGIEKKCKDYMDAIGGKLLKLQGVGLMGWPDRIAIAPTGRIMFVEFKKPGETPSVLQQKRLAAINRMGFKAKWFDDCDRFISAFASIPTKR